MGDGEKFENRTQNKGGKRKDNVSQYRQNDIQFVKINSPFKSVTSGSFYSPLSASLGGANDTSVHLPTLSPSPLPLALFP